MENRIGRALDIRGMKKIELAEKTDISKATISNWVNQKYQPKRESLSKLARVLNVSESWLAGYDTPMVDEIADSLLLLSQASKEIERLSGDKELIEDIKCYIERTKIKSGGMDDGVERGVH